MVTIAIDGADIEIQVQGVHKLWALKSSLRVPLSDVRDVRHDPERARRIMPGRFAYSLRSTCIGSIRTARRPGR